MGLADIFKTIAGVASIPLTGGATAPWVIPAAIGAAGIGGALANRQPKAQGQIRNLLFQHIQDRLNQPSALPAGYESQGIQGINHTYDVARQSAGNDLTARGLSTSPVAGAVMGASNDARAGDISRFQTSLPMLNRQMQDQDLGLASQAAGMPTPPSALGGAFSDAGSMLGFLIGNGAFGGGGKKNPAGVGSFPLTWGMGAHV